MGKRNFVGISRRTSLKRYTPLKRNQKQPTEQDAELDQWYDEKIASCNWICQNCNKNVYASAYIFQKACQAHLLCKKLFPSIKTHPRNHAVLGGVCGCHYAWDSDWERAQKMFVWPTLKEIIITELIGCLPADEYRKLPDVLREEYEQRYR